MHCLLYARVSTDKQAEKDLSIPAQLQLMREYARKQGWAVLGHYIDEGESARTADRPELKRLLQHCQKHRDVDVVLVHKIDRLARNLVDYATIKAVLKRRGIRLVSVAEHFDEGPVGQLMENIIASISEWYSANLGEEIKKAASAKLQRGEWPVGPPLGYRSVRSEDKRVGHVEDAQTAPLVRQAFERYATGQHSLQTLAEEMAERGLLTARGRPYSEEMMKRLLTRRFYISRLVWKGREYRGRHPPLVAKDVFYRVQDVLRARHRDTGEKGRLHFLLRGVVYCRTCGQRLTAERHPRGTYYRCLPDAKCAEPYVPVKLLETQLEALYDRLQAPGELLEAVRLEVQAVADRREAISRRELAGLRRTVATVEAKEMKLVDALVSSRVSRELYDRLSKRYTDERRAAEARVAQLEVDYRDPLDFLDKCLVVAGTLRLLHQRFKPEQRKMLVRALFKRIDVRERAIVGVTLNPPFSLFLRPPEDGVPSGPPPFEDPPNEGTDRDIFEHLLAYTLSPEYGRMRELIVALLPGARAREVAQRMAA
jgi:DNA invertase Pin-like site-specific DNA recombinase